MKRIVYVKTDGSVSFISRSGILTKPAEDESEDAFLGRIAADGLRNQKDVAATHMIDQAELPTTDRETWRFDVATGQIV